MGEIWGAVAGAAIGVVGNGLLNSGGQQSNQSSNQQMPAWMQAQWGTAIADANGAANRPASAAVAPLNAQQQQSFANAQASYGAGQGTLSNAAHYMYPIAQQGISPYAIQSYMSPYTNSVVNTTLGEMQTQENNQDAAINSQATAANAFGGNRAAVAQALNNQQWTQAMGQTAASLQNQGYMNAANIAGQSAGLQLQGANALTQNTLAGQQLLMQQNQNLLGAGNQQQQQAQNVANWPIQAAQIAGMELNPGVGGTVNSTGQYGSYMSPVQSGLLGAQMGNNLLNYYNNNSLNNFNNYQNNVVNPGVDNYVNGYLAANGG